MKLQIKTRHFELDEKISSYLEEKIGELDRYLPRAVRPGAEASVILELDPSGREDNQFVCEVILDVPDGPLVSKEATLNMYAAIDIVEAKLKAQLAKYKAKHSRPTRRARLKKRLSRETPVVQDETLDPETDRPDSDNSD